MRTTMLVYKYRTSLACFLLEVPFLWLHNLIFFIDTPLLLLRFLARYLFIQSIVKVSKLAKQQQQQQQLRLRSSYTPYCKLVSTPWGIFGQACQCFWQGFLLISNRNFSRSAKFPKLGTSSQKRSKYLSQDSSYALHVNKIYSSFSIDVRHCIADKSYPLLGSLYVYQVS